jgi:hypothetical protein
MGELLLQTLRTVTKAVIYVPPLAGCPSPTTCLLETAVAGMTAVKELIRMD